MIQLAVDEYFTNGFFDSIDGDGELKVEGNVLKVAGGGNDRAVKSFYIPVKNMTIIEVEVLARSIKGEARMHVDFATRTNYVLADYTSTTSKEWEKLKLKVIVPPNNKYDNAYVGLGKWRTQNEEVIAEYKELRVKIGNSYGSSLTIAQGLIRLNNGEVDIRKGFKSHGLKSFTFLGDGLRVELDSVFVELEGGTKPILQVTGTPDFPGIPVAGTFLNNAFIIKWTDGTSFIDMTGKTAFVFITVSI